MLYIQLFGFIAWNQLPVYTILDTEQAKNKLDRKVILQIILNRLFDVQITAQHETLLNWPIVN